MKKSVRDVDVRGKRVLVRADFNVPLKDHGIVDDSRIRAFLPTLTYLIEQGAHIAVCAHLGRPDGAVNAALSLAPVAGRLGELLGKDVALCGDCIGDQVEKAISRLDPGELVLLENTRFHPGEEANDREFARRLAAPFDVFVNDAFGTADRAHASTEGVAHHLPAVAGLLMLSEIKIIRGLRENPEHPFVLILGGAKTSSKLPVLNRLMDRVDHILVGGGTCNTFLVAQGVEIGRSEFEASCVEAAGNMLAVAGDKMVLPVDAVVAEDLRDDVETRVVPIDAIPKEWRKVDIGPETVKVFARHLSKVKTVAWNGPLGFTELEPFGEGTRQMGSVIAELDAMTVIGGGDTIAALRSYGLDGAMSHLSTGGGAFFKLLETDDLPALNVLQDME